MCGCDCLFMDLEAMSVPECENVSLTRWKQDIEGLLLVVWVIKCLSLKQMIFVFRFIHFFLVTLGIGCCLQVSLSFAEQGLLSSCGGPASPYGGLSHCGPWDPWCTGFKSHGSQASLSRGMWNLPRPGIKPESCALAGRFFTAGPEEKSVNDVSELPRLTLRCRSTSVTHVWVSFCP